MKYCEIGEMSYSVDSSHFATLRSDMEQFLNRYFILYFKILSCLDQCRQRQEE